MVRRPAVESSQARVVSVVPPRDWKAEHAEYWSEENQARMKRFEVEAGGLHIQDDFRIVCDGIQVDGSECLNVICLPPPKDDHDGLCERCRRLRLPFRPRIHLTPERVIYDHWELDRWRDGPKPWLKGDAYEEVK